MAEKVNRWQADYCDDEELKEIEAQLNADLATVDLEHDPEDDDLPLEGDDDLAEARVIVWGFDTHEPRTPARGRHRRRTPRTRS
jgi:hypothetical protein